MNTKRLSSILLASLLGSACAFAQVGVQTANEPAPDARKAPDTAVAVLDPRSHSYGLHARHDIRSTKTRAEVQAELMEARAAEARQRRGQRSSD